MGVCTQAAGDHDDRSLDEGDQLVLHRLVGVLGLEHPLNVGCDPLRLERLALGVEAGPRSQPRLR